MRKIIITISLIVCANLCFAQTNYKPEGLILVKDISKLQNQNTELSSMVIKDNKGNIIEQAIFLLMNKSGKYNIDIYGDDKGNIKEFVLRLKPGEVEVIDVKTELELLKKRDQLLRKLTTFDGYVTKTYGKESYEYNYISSLMSQEDKKNQEKVIQIIEEHGWLGKSEVGDIGNKTLFLVIQHAPLSLQEKYFPLLKASAEKGESNLEDMALMDDRIRRNKKQKQLYGSQTRSVNGKHYIIPIEDPINVDKRRKSVGLPPLADYLKLIGLTYPQDEMPIELFER